MSRAYRHVVWDWNGTLIDDAWLCIEITNQLLAEGGLPAMAGADYRRLFGFPLKDYTVRLGFPAREFEAVSEAFIKSYEERRDECALQPGARRVLVAIQQGGLEQSILSAYKQSTLDEVVRQRGLMPFFARLNGVDNHFGQGKIDNGRRWLAAMGLPPGQVVLVGDTLHDVEVARSMEVNCLLVPGGHQSRARLRTGGVPLVADLAAVAQAICGDQT